MSYPVLLLVVLVVAAAAIGLYRWKRAADRRERRMARRERQLGQLEAWDRAMAESRPGD